MSLLPPLRPRLLLLATLAATGACAGAKHRPAAAPSQEGAAQKAKDAAAQGAVAAAKGAVGNTQGAMNDAKGALVGAKGAALEAKAAQDANAGAATEPNAATGSAPGASATDHPAITDPAATGAATLRAAVSTVAAVTDLAPKGNVLELATFPEALAEHDVAVSFLAPPTHLFWFPGATVLTDPGAHEAAHGAKAADANAPSVAASLAQLTHLELVVLSRDDDAHLDAAMAKALWHKFHPDFLVPPGGRHRLVRAGVPAKRIFERRAWQAVKIDHGKLTASFVPTEPLAKGRAARASAMGVMFAHAGHHVLYVAHGRVGHHFQAIRDRFGSPAMSVLPVAAPAADGGKDVDDALGPHEAVLVHRLLDSQLAVGAPASPAAVPDHAAKRAAALTEAQAVHGLNADCFVSPQPYRTLQVSLDRPGPCAPAPAATKAAAAPAASATPSAP